MTSVQDLMTSALADADLAGLLSRGDWYLVGSRAHGFEDELSDWDTVLLTADDLSPDERALVGRARLDSVFGIEGRPALPQSDLRAHVAGRRSGGVEISVFGPAGRLHRDEGGNPIWAYEMAHAVPLRTPTGIGEPYRAKVAAVFEVIRAGLRDEAYLRFRMSRNEAAATLARTDAMAQAITTALCVQQACRFWLLAAGSPYPTDKWLAAALAATDSTADVPAAARAVADVAVEPEKRFAALWSLWQLVDTRAAEVGVDPDLLAGSPFVDRPEGLRRR